MTELKGTGFDCGNPVAFLAAVGLVVAAGEVGISMTLAWEERGANMIPVFQFDTSEEELGEKLLTLALQTLESPSILTSILPEIVNPDGTKRKQPITHEMVQQEEALYHQGIRLPYLIRGVLWSDIVNGKLVKTSWDTTTRKLTYPATLKRIAGLFKERSGEDLITWIREPWPRKDGVNGLEWDPTLHRFSSEEGKFKADQVCETWALFFALVGMTLYPPTTRRAGSDAATKFLPQGWILEKVPKLVYPLWKMPLDLTGIRTAISLPEIFKDPSENVLRRLQLRGIHVVCESRQVIEGSGGLKMFMAEIRHFAVA